MNTGMSCGGGRDPGDVLPRALLAVLGPGRVEDERLRAHAVGVDAAVQRDLRVGAVGQRAGQPGLEQPRDGGGVAAGTLELEVRGRALGHWLLPRWCCDVGLELTPVSFVERVLVVNASQPRKRSTYGAKRARQLVAVLPEHLGARGRPCPAGRAGGRRGTSVMASAGLVGQLLPRQLVDLRGDREVVGHEVVEADVERAVAPGSRPGPASATAASGRAGRPSSR